MKQRDGKRPARAYRRDGRPTGFLRLTAWVALFVVILVLAACSGDFDRAPTPVYHFLTPSPTPTSTPAPLSEHTVPYLEQSLRAGAGTADAFAWSPNGAQLAVAGSLGVTLYDSVTLERIASFAEREWLSSVAYSPDGEKLALGNVNGSVQIWDVAEGRQVTEMAGGQTKISSLAFSRDGRLLASTGEYDITNIWEVETGRLVQRLPGERSGSQAIAFSADGTTFASLSGRELRVRRLPEARPLYPPRPTAGWARALTFLADDRIVTISDGQPARIQIWSASSGTLLDDFGWEIGNPRFAAFSPNERHLAAAHEDGTVQILSLPGQELVRTLEDGGALPQAISFSPDGSRVAKLDSDGELHIWQVGSGDHQGKIAAHPTVRTSVVSPDGQRAAHGGYDGSVRVWDVASGESIAQLTPAACPGAVLELSFDGEGDLLAVSTSDRKVRVFRLADGSPLGPWGKCGVSGSAGVLTPDGSALAVVKDSDILVYRLEDGAIISRITREDRAVRQLKFSPDGASLAVAIGYGPLEVWDVASGELLHELGSERGGSDSLAFSSDGRTLAVGYRRDGRVELWQLQGGWLRHEFEAAREAVSALAFDPGDRLLAAASGTAYSDHGDWAVELWSVGSGERAFHTAAVAGRLESISFHADGRAMISAGADGSVRVWQASAAPRSVSERPSPTNVPFASPTPTATLHPLPHLEIRRLSSLGLGAANTATFSPAGERLAVAGRNSLHILDGETLSTVAHFPLRPDESFIAAYPDVADQGGEIVKAAYSPDGRHIATASHYFILLWDAETGEFVRHLGGRPGHDPPLGEVQEMLFSRDGSQLVVRSMDIVTGGHFNVQVFDVNAGEFLYELGAELDEVTAIARSQDDAVAVADANGSISLWDTFGEEQLAVLAGHAASVNDLLFLPQTGQLVSAGSDASIILWDVQSGERLRTLDEFSAPVTRLIFDPGSNQIYFLVGAERWYRWRPDSGGQAVAVVMPQEEPVAFHPQDGRLLSRSEAGFNLWHPSFTRAVAEARGFVPEAASLRFSPDGRFLAAGNYQGISLWDLELGALTHALPADGYDVGSYAFHPDGSRLATADHEGVAIWDVASGARLMTLEAGDMRWQAVDYSPDGQFLTASSAAGVHIWNASSGERLGVLQADDLETGRVVFDATGDALLSVGRSGRRIQRWDLSALSRSGALPDQPSAVIMTGAPNPDSSAHSLFTAFSSDRSRLALGYERFDEDRRQVEVWDLASGEIIAAIEIDAYVQHGVLDHEGNLLAVETSTGFSLWDVASGRRLFQETLDTGYIAGLALGPDATALAVAHGDGTIQLWDLGKTAELAGTIPTPRAQPRLDPTPEPTATAVPQLTLTPLAATSVNSGALTAVQAADLQERARIGQGNIEAAAWSPDGEVLAVAGSLGVHLHRTTDLAEIASFDAGVWLHALAFSPDGSLLAAGRADGRVELWDINSERLVRSIEAFAPREYSNEIRQLAFSPDGRLLAAVQETLRFWRVADGRLVAELDLPVSNTFSFLPSGGAVAAPGADQTTQIWRIEDGAVLTTLSGQLSWVREVAIASDGTLAASAGGYGAEVLVHRLEDGDVVARLEGSQGEYDPISINHVSFSPDALQLAYGGDDGVIYLWNLVDRKLERRIEAHRSPLEELSFSPDGRILLSLAAGHDLKLWHLAGEGGSVSLQGYRAAGGFTPLAGGRVITWQESALELWTASTGRRLAREPVPPGRLLTVNPSGEQIALHVDNWIELRQVEGGELESVLEAYPDVASLSRNENPSFVDAVFSPDGGLLAAVGSGPAWLLDVQTGQSCMEIGPQSPGWGSALAFSPDGHLLATHHHTIPDPSLNIWRVHSGRLLRSVEPSVAPRTLAFSRDGLHLGGAAEAGVALWDLRTGQERTLALEVEGAEAVVFGPANDLLAAGDQDGGITLWSFPDGRRIGRLEAHRGEVIGLAFSLDGRFLISQGQDGTLRIWAAGPSN